MKYMVLQPPYSSSILSDGSGDYHVDEFDSREEALNFCEAAKKITSLGLAKKIRCVEYTELSPIK